MHSGEVTAASAASAASVRADALTAVAAPHAASAASAIGGYGGNSALAALAARPRSDTINVRRPMSDLIGAGPPHASPNKGRSRARFTRRRQFSGFRDIAGHGDALGRFVAADPARGATCPV